MERKSPGNSSRPVRKQKRRLKKPVRYFLLFSGLVVSVLILQLFIRILFSSSQPAALENYSGTLVAEAVPDTGETIATVLIDPGHGGYDSGKLPEDGSDIYEKEITLDIALKVKAELERINPNIEVLLTRTSDEVDWPAEEVADLTYREEMQQKVGADYFLSLHCNADSYPDTAGYIFFLKPNDTTSLSLARAMDANFQEIGWSSLHSYNTSELLQVVTNSHISSILLEMGFMTNDEDMALFKDEAMTDQLATAIAKAYSDYIQAHPNMDTTTMTPAEKAERVKAAKEQAEKEQAASEAKEAATPKESSEKENTSEKNDQTNADV